MRRPTFLSIVRAGMLCSALLASAGATAAAVVNGGFEAQDFSGWTYQGSGASVVDVGMAHTGDYAAYLGDAGTTGSLSTILNTELGHFYALDFFLANLGGSIFNDNTVASFALYLNGSLTPAFSLVDKTATDYLEHSFAFTATGPTTIDFEFRHDESYWMLDDVALIEALPGGGPGTLPPVLPPAQVPEPSTLLLSGAALLLIARQRRR